MIFEVIFAHLVWIQPVVELIMNTFLPMRCGVPVNFAAVSTDGGFVEISSCAMLVG